MLVTFSGMPIERGQSLLVDWVRRSAAIVGGYYDGFPVPVADVRIVAVDGGGVRGGRAFSAMPEASVPGIRVTVGRDVKEDDLLRDWVLVHEMTHLALPEVGREHAWLAEGLATYVEGAARVQAGNMTELELWQEYVHDMPKGLPSEDDEGLDRTHTWARTYWGGALFCLLADVGIHERTDNRFGLQDALRAIMRGSGGMTATWPIGRVFSVGDAATGTTVLSDLYAEMATRPRGPDLATLWKRLGIDADSGTVTLERGSDAAAVREAITRSRRPAAASAR